ncbi:hydrogenase nickel incorporation protein HypB [Methyloceanibacter methanicus]|uniref:Hydrogenase maturation factor HypB n=1 Tax=Methyloceanibacter methanicus TaxID=1774968 RepID=A0A1E3W0S5_9HYPH|nr:hydrogenase nickel incorporation protein HypB [Methyloceanibacter methanicus]ODR99408.1 hydrogenase nickel incorporation protein HypB [Methyloceanibacter methanicus]
MCGHCGCGSDAKVTVIDLKSGAAHSHEHEHVHEDGTRHAHPHEHDHAHGHDHDHDDHAHGHEHHHAHEHVHADGTRHSHPHDHPHEHEHDHGHEHHHHGDARGENDTVVALEARILAKNDAAAAKNRAWFADHRILALNLVSSPGAGKTTLLERTIKDMKDALPLFVLEGDQATANDGLRIRAAGAPAVQVNTGTGCHLEADMVARGLDQLSPTPDSVVMIENVGNLVCPAMFDLGEHAKVAILSVTEGDDKPLKYPHMFRAADLVLINKIDLLPHVDFDVAAAVRHALDVNPRVNALTVSARTGEGLGDWYAWLKTRRLAAGSRAGARNDPGSGDAIAEGGRS